MLKHNNLQTDGKHTIKSLILTVIKLNMELGKMRQFRNQTGIFLIKETVD